MAKSAKKGQIAILRPTIEKIEKRGQFYWRNFLKISNHKGVKKALHAIWQKNLSSLKKLFFLFLQTTEDVVMLNGFGTIVNALGKRVKPYLPQICGTILFRHVGSHLNLAGFFEGKNWNTIRFWQDFGSSLSLAHKALNSGRSFWRLRDPLFRESTWLMKSHNLTQKVCEKVCKYVCSQLPNSTYTEPTLKLSFLRLESDRK